MHDSRTTTTQRRIDARLPSDGDLWLSTSSSQEVVLVTSCPKGRVRYLIATWDLHVVPWETQLSLFMTQYTLIAGSRAADPNAPQARKLMLDRDPTLSVREDGTDHCWPQEAVAALAIDPDQPLPVVRGQLTLRLQRLGFTLVRLEALDEQIIAVVTIARKGGAIESQ
jgi:hypothetical protein